MYAICINLSFVTYKHTQWGETAVYNASNQGYSEVVKLLVQAGADLELQNKVIHIFMPWKYYTGMAMKCPLAL